MADKETRKRKKRKDSVKKEDTDDSSPPREQSPREKKAIVIDDHHHHSHDPSIIAKVVFFILFSVLIGAIGIVLFTLPSSSVNRELEERNSHDDHESHEIEEVHLDIELPVILNELIQEETEEIIINNNESDEQLSSLVEESIELDQSELQNLSQNEVTEQSETNFDNSLDDDQQTDDENNPEEQIHKLENDEIHQADITDSEETFQSAKDNTEKGDIILEDDDDDDDDSGDLIIKNLRNEDKDEISDQKLESLIEEEILDLKEFAEENIFENFENERRTDESELVDIRKSNDNQDLSNNNNDLETDDNLEIQPSSVLETTESTIEEINDKEDLKLENDQTTQQDDKIEDKKYEKEAITNDYDFLFRDELDDADNIVAKFPEKALKSFETILSKHPQSLRAVYGKATALDKLAEIQKSNAILEKAIDLYKQVMATPDVPDQLYLQSGNRCVNRMHFRGLVGKALAIQSELARKFPDDVDTQNQLAVSYLMFGRGQDAKKILLEVLKKYPTSGFAKVHLGFIFKTEDKLYPEAIKYLQEGIASKEPGVIDGRFYFHLGDALSRSGQNDEALLVYGEGVKEGLFLSTLQRSLYNVKGLKGNPWWRKDQTPYQKELKILEDNYIAIRNEAVSLMSKTQSSGFEPENEGLQDTGDWQQFNLFLRGKKIDRNCKLAPKTCALIDKFPDAASCKRGQVKFSIMQPGTHVWAHTGPTNCRLRAHLGLVVPTGTRMRVGNETRSWSEGKFLIFDDSFEHEVWHEGETFRLILIVDFWHPELTNQQKKSLTPL